MEANWKNGRQSLTRIECHSENSKGVYCLQYDDKKIVSGLRDNTIKVSAESATKTHIPLLCGRRKIGYLRCCDVIVDITYFIVERESS